MSVITLRAVEHGGMGVTFGAYAAVLHVLGLDTTSLRLQPPTPVGAIGKLRHFHARRVYAPAVASGQ